MNGEVPLHNKRLPGNHFSRCIHYQKTRGHTDNTGTNTENAEEEGSEIRDVDVPATGIRNEHVRAKDDWVVEELKVTPREVEVTLHSVTS